MVAIPVWVVVTAAVLAGTVVTSGLAGLILSEKEKVTTRSLNDELLPSIDVDAAVDGTIKPESLTYQWRTDRLLAYNDKTDIYSRPYPADTSDTEKLAPMNIVLHEGGDPVSVESYVFSEDGQIMLFSTEKEKRWRHSGSSSYYLLDLSQGTAETRSPLAVNQGVKYMDMIFVNVKHSNPAENRYRLVGVRDNTIYRFDFVRDNEGNLVAEGESGVPLRNPNSENNVYVATPDWLYEEEVFASKTAMYPSSDGQYLIYSVINDEGTPLNNYTYFPTDGRLYPEEISLPYAKPGEAIPVISIEVIDITKDATQTPRTVELFDGTNQMEEFYIFAFGWVKDSIIVRISNRAQTEEFSKKCVLDVDKYSCTDYYHQKVSHGWIPNIERGMPCVIEDTSDIDCDIVDIFAADPTENAGYPLFPKILCVSSNGNSEKKSSLPVMQSHVSQPTSILACSSTRVIAVTTDPSPLQRQITVFERSNEGSFMEGKSLGNPSKVGVYKAYAVSPNGEALIASYEDIDVPPIVYVGSLDNMDFEAEESLIITKNQPMIDELNKYRKPLKQLIINDSIPGDKTTKGCKIQVQTNGPTESGYKTISDCNSPPGLMGEILLPPTCDTSVPKSCPLLLQVYGGPDAQEATGGFPSIDFLYYMASNGVVVITLDGAGTGYRGSDFSNQVYGKLGDQETRDYVAALNYLCSDEDDSPYSYLDCSRAGVYGWSYGGYMTTMITTGLGELHVPITTAVAVAPVTDWRLYDATYTERYMGVYDSANPYWEKSAIFYSQFISQGIDYMEAHGTGDDNVNFLNSARLIHSLIQRGYFFKSYYYPNMPHSPTDDATKNHIYKTIMRHFNETMGTLPSF